MQILIALACLLAVGCRGADTSGPVVLTPASTQEVMEALADAWAQTGHTRPVLSFAGTPAVVRQIEQGSPADVVITADQDWMDWLENAQLIRADTRRVVLGNELVLVGSQPEKQERSIEQRLLALGAGRLAIGDPETVPAGRYAKATLEQMGLWDTVSSNVVPTDNVRTALSLVEAGEARLGIVYATDARAAPHVFDAEVFKDQPAILYPGALVADAQHPDAAAFLAFLSSEEAHAIIAQHGFQVIENSP